MDQPPDSPDSLSGDHLTGDLLNGSRGKRRRALMNDVSRRTPDVKDNNNDVDFVLMEEENHQENGDDEVCRLIEEMILIIKPCRSRVLVYLTHYEC